MGNNKRDLSSMDADNVDPASESQANLKKQKIHMKSEEIDDDTIIVSKSEYNQLKETIKLLSETMKMLQETLLTKSDLLEFSLKEKAVPKKKEETVFTCCFECEEASGNNDQTILVNGFGNVRPRDAIKNNLSKIFGSFGEITRVFVPTECKTGVPLGFAFINLRNGEGNEKALELNKSYMYGRKIKVKMATDSDKFYGYPNFGGCERCRRSTFGRRCKDPDEE